MPDQHGRTLGKRTVATVAIDAGPQEGAATEESVTIGNGLYLLGRIGGNGVSFLVDTGSGVSILAACTWRKWGRTEDELTRYWGRLCSVEGRALECLGKAKQSKGDRSYSPGPRDSDGGSRTRTAGAVPGPRNSRGQARQQHLVGQHRITADSNRQGLGSSPGRMCSSRTQSQRRERPRRRGRSERVGGASVPAPYQ